MNKRNGKFSVKNIQKFTFLAKNFSLLSVILYILLPSILSLSFKRFFPTRENLPILFSQKLIQNIF
jgi:hypothetical protein